MLNSRNNRGSRDVITDIDRRAIHCPSPCGRLARRAIFRFTETPNQWLKCGHPVPARGAVARRHERGMGCGGRDSVGAQVRSQGELNLVSDLQARKTNDV
jgi:hypothetical protein